MLHNRIGTPFLILILGALAMADTATADDKKEKPKDPSKDASYDEKVSIRRFEGGKLNSPENAAKDVPAYRFEKGGALMFVTKAKAASTPTVRSEITDKDGNVYVVQKVVEKPGIGCHLSTVKLKPKDK